MYVVEHYRHPVAGSLSQSNVPRYNTFKDLGAKEASKVGGHLLRQSSSVVVHRKKDTFNDQRGINCPAEAHQRIKKLGDTLKG